MKKSTIWLLVVLGFLILGYWLIAKQPWRNAKLGFDAFSVKDTALVTKLFLANKTGEKILLERQPNNQWMVNGKFLADDPKVRLLLETLHAMQIQKPLSPNMHNKAIAILASTGIKTEVYAGEKLIKTIYVGSETPDKTGTIMLLEGENEPYAIHVPGFVGFLTPRFFTNEIKWRNKLLFNLPANQIKSCSITYPGQPAESFEFNIVSFGLKGSIFVNDGWAQADTQQVKLFIHSFENKYVEGYFDDQSFTPHERDSVEKLIPYCIIQLVDLNEKSQKVTLFEKVVGDRTKTRFDDRGNPLTNDPDKFFAKIDGINQMASIQEYAFRRILVKGSTLIKKGFKDR